MPRPAPESYRRLRALVAVEESGTASLPVCETFTGEQIADVPAGRASDVDRAIAVGSEAAESWQRVPVSIRARVLTRFAALVLSHRQGLMDFIQAETGKARISALEEITDVVLNARYYGTNAPRLLAPKRVQGMFPGFTKAVVHRRLKGVVGIISPFNFPASLPVSDALPALVAGNAVIVKPDPLTPSSLLACAELLYEAGLPRDLFAVVTGNAQAIGMPLAAQVDYLAFTGSVAVGKSLGRTMGERLVGYSAELGGKNPMIIAAGANIGQAAEEAARGCFANSGQLCVSIERIYVERSVADEFITGFSARVRRIKLAAGYEFDTEMGSQSSLQRFETVSKHVQDAVSKGATVLAGGKPRPDLGPYFYEPTVLTGVTEDMMCHRDETFGPLVSVYPVDSVDEAVELANSLDVGLSASVWAGSDSEAERIGARIKAGGINVNEGYAASWGSTAAPTGGMKDSGIGRRHGEEGLLKYTEPQTIATQRILGAGTPSWVSQKAWAIILPAMLRLLSRMPGR
ncbi:MAG: succinate-semialdehyde dehydrogenase (NADP(+)) [Actinobacteria bacterium]|nr:succinate-semialdehyde dehydrogenase (NADP(+)) [Actinomycetota bacterium]